MTNVRVHHNDGCFSHFDRVVVILNKPNVLNIILDTYRKRPS